MSDQQSPSGQIDLGPWCCYAGENGSPTSECSPENPIHSPTHCGYDNVRRCLVPAPGSGSPAGEQAESSEADQMRAAWAKACASLSPSAPSTPVDDERPESDADQLREAANWLDTYDQMARVFFDILARSDQMPNDQRQQAKALTPVASSNEVQTDLRRIADSLERPAPPVSPPVPERLDVTELPEWAALVDAVNDDGGSVAGYRANVTGRASALTRAVRAAAADREDRADG